MLAFSGSQNAAVFEQGKCLYVSAGIYRHQHSTRNLHILRVKAVFRPNYKQQRQQGCAHPIIASAVYLIFNSTGWYCPSKKASAHDRLAVCRQSDVNKTDSTAEALLFVRGLLVEGRATAEPQATVKVLRHLAQDPQPGAEDSFVAVLQTATLQGVQILRSLLLLTNLVLATQ